MAEGQLVRLMWVRTGESDPCHSCSNNHIMTTEGLSLRMPSTERPEIARDSCTGSTAAFTQSIAREMFLCEPSSLLWFYPSRSLSTPKGTGCFRAFKE